MLDPENIFSGSSGISEGANSHNLSFEVCLFASTVSPRLTFDRHSVFVIISIIFL